MCKLSGHPLAPACPAHKYGSVSLSNVVATTCQYEALKYVSFPVQTLGKCAKMIPVMIWGYAINGKTYKLADYLVACGVMTGCTLFAMYGETTSKAAEGPSTGIYGIALMLGYLGFDGFTSTFQQMLYRRYSTSILNQIFFTTCFSSCMSTAWLLTTDQVPGVIQFIKIHPECVQDIFTLSVSSAVSQFLTSFG